MMRREWEDTMDRRPYEKPVMDVVMIENAIMMDSCPLVDNDPCDWELPII